MEKIWITESKIELGNCKDILPKYYGGQISLVVTSPPYFNQKECATGGSMAGGYRNIVEYFDDMTIVFEECLRLAKPGCVLAINIGSDTTFDLPSWWSMMMDQFSEIKYIDRIAWVKGSGNITRGFHIDARNKYYPFLVWEPIYIYQKSRNAGFSVDAGFPEFEDRFKDLIGSLLRTNVWRIPQDNEAPWHPAPYPRKLIYNLIACYTQKDDIILDPFGGAMTTALAAEDIGNRKYLICELKEDFYEQGIKRLEQHKGKTQDLFQ